MSEPPAAPTPPGGPASTRRGPAGGVPAPLRRAAAVGRAERRRATGCPPRSSSRAGRSTVPDGFRFAVKMPGSALRRLRRLRGARRAARRPARPGPPRRRDRPRDDGMLTLLLGSLDPGLRLALDLRARVLGGRRRRARGAGRTTARPQAPFRYLRFRDPPYERGGARLDRPPGSGRSSPRTSRSSRTSGTRTSRARLPLPSACSPCWGRRRRPGGGWRIERKADETGRSRAKTAAMSSSLALLLIAFAFAALVAPLGWMARTSV